MSRTWYPADEEAMPSLLKHVANDVCTDPDCEIHQIAVGLEEETVAPTDLAFFIAGAQAMELAIRHEFYKRVPFDDGAGSRAARAALRESCLEAGRPILKLAERFFPGTSQP